MHELPTAAKLALAVLAPLALALALGHVVSALRRRRLEGQRRELLGEVGLLQAALLPPVPERVGVAQTSVAYRPAAGLAAGGDFYDALTLPGRRAAFILGDVSGHGRAALERTAFIRYTLRAYLEAGLSPRAALEVGSSVIDQHLDGDFATVVVCVHDPRDATLTYACAGHPAPIVIGAERYEPVLAASSLPIGMGMRTGVRQTRLPFPPGTTACLYTDGLAEARSGDRMLGRPRLADIVAELGPGASATDLLDRVSAESSRVTDDMAAILISPTAGPTAGGFRLEELELDASETTGDLPAKFLDACGVTGKEGAAAQSDCRRVAHTHGAAVLQVQFGVNGPDVEVAPRDTAILRVAEPIQGAA